MPQIAQIQLMLPAWVAESIDCSRAYPGDEAKMQLAIDLARRNVEYETGGPFGAALFEQDDRVIGWGVNRVVPQNCSAAHAEMMAFMSTQQRLGRFRLNEGGQRITMATSAQPCCMCYGGTVWAGIDTLLIGASKQDVESLSEFDEGPLPADWVGELERRGITVRQHILQPQAREVFHLYAKLNGQFY